MQVRFTQSARGHRVGRQRALDVINNPRVVLRLVRRGQPDVLMHLGDDRTGRALEVGVVEEGDTLVVLHVMDLRDKYRAAYEAGKEQR